MFAADYETLKPYLAAALAAEQSDTDAHERVVAAEGMVKAAELLAGEYSLVITNVPYVGRGKQSDKLKEYLEEKYFEGKADLSTAFVLRSLQFCREAGTAALVTPQNWLFLTTYKKMRALLLKHRTWNLVVRLGENAFESTAAAGAFGALEVISASKPLDGTTMAGLDVSATRAETPIYAEEKAARLANRLPTPVQLVRQSDQLQNPDSIIQLREAYVGTLLDEYASCFQGVSTEDNYRFTVKFWEVQPSAEFRRFQSAPQDEGMCGGCETLVRSELLEDSLRKEPCAVEGLGEKWGWRWPKPAGCVSYGTMVTFLPTQRQSLCQNPQPCCQQSGCLLSQESSSGKSAKRTKS